jgi:hypothetical protein
MVTVIYEDKAKGTKVFIELVPDEGKTARYVITRCALHDEQVDLGEILWKGGWWQYIFQPLPNTVWSASCLSNISAFLEGLNAFKRKR